jgi:hypothetical protein
MKSVFVVFPFLILVASSEVSAQPDTLNQLDSAGLKQGTWLVYLDEDWNKKCHLVILNTFE